MWVPSSLKKKIIIIIKDDGDLLEKWVEGAGKASEGGGPNDFWGQMGYFLAKKCPIETLTT